MPANPGASAAMTNGINRPISAVATIRAALTVPSTRPAKACGRFRALGLAHAQPGRHQRRVQRALGEQPPDHIDELERHQEGVRDRARAEQRRDHGIAREIPAAARPACPWTR